MLPDLIVPLEGFDLILSDIRIGNYMFPPFDLYLEGDGSGDLKVDDVELDLKFRFNLSQTQYPYVKDSGTGQLLIRGIEMAGHVSGELSEECEYHARMPVAYTNSHLGSL